MPVPQISGAPARELLRDNVYASLRDAIVDGTLAPGERLRDTEIEAWLGVSRTPIREALLRLERAGLQQLLSDGRVVAKTRELEDGTAVAARRVDGRAMAQQHIQEREHHSPSLSSVGL